MGHFDWVDTKIKIFNWTDIGLIKFSVAGFVFMIAKVWTGFGMESFALPQR